MLVSTLLTSLLLSSLVAAQGNSRTRQNAASNKKAATGGNGGNNAAVSKTLQDSVICTGCAAANPNATAGQAASLTSTVNFIDFCAGQTITNGKQLTGGGCNPIPMGQLPSNQKIPSCKFQFPKNGQTITADQDFSFSLAVSDLALGTFTNAQLNYYSAPQQLDGSGTIIGHTHITVTKIAAMDDTAIPDPLTFAFFKGVNDAGKNGVVTVPVTGGLPKGTYRVCTINSSSNHQPVLAPVAQHGAIDDCVYFIAAGGNGAAATATAKTTTKATAKATTKATGKATTKGAGKATTTKDTGKATTAKATAKATTTAKATAKATTAKATGKATTTAKATTKARGTNTKNLAAGGSKTKTKTAAAGAATTAAAGTGKVCPARATVTVTATA